jgi:branched-chain amino acid transport system permease protein
VTYFLQLLVTGVAVGSIYALAAMGFVLVYKSSRVINFAQGQLIAIGAFGVFALSVWVGIPIWIALALMLGLMFLIGRGIERVFLRPMVGEPIISVIMVTIGLASLLSGLIFLTPFGTMTARFPQYLPAQPLALGGVLVRWEHLVGMGLTALFLAVASWFFTRTTIGIGMRAVSDDQLASLSVGVDVERVFGLAWAAAAMSATGAAFVVGSLYGVEFAGLVAVGLRVFPAVILGGMDSVPGAVVGGITVGVLEQLASGYLDAYVPGGGTGDVFPFVALLLILLIKPHGLFGTVEIERV